jgi:hypothetical protein
VSFEAPSGGGGAVWGDITGTLSDQTDLQTALDGKFDDPTGTSAQYIRGDGSLATFPAIPSGTVTSVGLTMPSAFSVANSPVTSSGTLAVTATGDTTQYIAGDGSLVAFPITGQAGTLVREVRNVTGATLTKGTVVYINGASGNKPTVAKALATGDATSAQTFGLIQANIPNNSNGYLVAFGDLDGLNTSAFAEGVQLYLSATTAGEYTSTKQYAPNHLVYIGVVTRQHVNQGRIEVRIQNGYEMDELHDVAAQTPSNNDGLFYNSTNSLWENKSIATALGYTPANAATTLTINGVTYDLSANRSWTVAGGISGSGASGQVAYWTGTSAQAGSNNLFWDAANGFLGIGTNAPTAPLNVVASSAGEVVRLNGTVNTSLRFTNDSSGRANISVYGNTSATSASGAYFNAFGYQESWFLVAANQASTGNKNWRFGNLGSSNYFAIQKLNDALDSITSSPFIIHSTSSNVSIGSGFVSDSGERLQVNGTMKVTGVSTFAANVDLTLNQNANTRLQITNTNSSTSSYTSIATISNGSGMVEVGKYSQLKTAYKIVASGDGYFFNNIYGDIAILNDFATGNIKFAAGGSSTAQMTIHNTGNLLIGSTSNSGERLQVTGNTLLKGSGADSGTFALTAQNSAGTNTFRVRNDGYILIGQASTSAAPAIYAFEGTTGLRSLRIGIQSAGSLTPIPAFNINQESNYTYTTGTGEFTTITANFLPTSGTATLAYLSIKGTINQTGGANGITRGLYINPTLTAAADFRAIETTNGKVIFGNLPTSSAGLPTGAIWNDAGTIKIV